MDSDFFLEHCHQKIHTVKVGLSGEVRAVSMAGQRVAEAKKLGFDTVILPEVCKSSVGKAAGVNLIYVSWIQDAIRFIMKNN